MSRSSLAAAGFPTIFSQSPTSPIAPATVPFGRRPDDRPIALAQLPHERSEKGRNAGVEILDSIELALRLKVKASWVVEQSKRSRTADPIPVLRLGKHRRYRWGSPEMNDWLARRAGCTTTSRKTWS